MKHNIWISLFLLVFVFPVYAERLSPEEMQKNGITGYKQLSEALELTILISTYMQDYYQQHNACPASNQAIYLPNPTDITTEVIQSISVNSACEIITTFKTTPIVIKAIQGKTLSITMQDFGNFRASCKFNGDAHYLLTNDQCNKTLDSYYDIFYLDQPSADYKKLNNYYETNNPSLAIYKKQVESLYDLIDHEKGFFNKLVQTNQKCPSEISELKFDKNRIAENEYLDQISFTNPCEITASFKKASPVKPELQGKTISFKYSTSPAIYSFICSSNIDGQYLPEACLLNEKSTKEQVEEAYLTIKNGFRFYVTTYYDNNQQCPQLVEDLVDAAGDPISRINTPYLDSITLDQCNIIGVLKKAPPVKPELYGKMIEVKIKPSYYSTETSCISNIDNMYLPEVCQK